MAIYPNEMVPLQIDLSRGDRRYRFALAANPTRPLLCAGRPGELRGRGSVFATTRESEFVVREVIEKPIDLLTAATPPRPSRSDSMVRHEIDSARGTPRRSASRWRAVSAARS